MPKLTPMLRQYRDIKEKYPDAFLFFRLGDFYEMFFDDAIEASAILEIVLTARSGGEGLKVPMCGVPYHSANGYIRQLIEANHKVAICDQVEDPKDAKGIVKREVVRVITPGTVLEEDALSQKENNHLLCLSATTDQWGLAYGDMTTGSFYATEITKMWGLAPIKDELARINPSEIVLDLTTLDELSMEEIGELDYYISTIEDPVPLTIRESIEKMNPDKESLWKHIAADLAATQLLAYLEQTQKQAISNMTHLDYYKLDEAMQMDHNTRRNLEITESIRRNDKKTSLVSVLDRTSTAMGARKLKRWLQRPLLSITSIEARQAYVGALVDDVFLSNDLKPMLKATYDLERILTRVSYERAHARDLKSMQITLYEAARIRTRLLSADPLLRLFADELDVVSDLEILLAKALIDEPPLTIKEGDIIADGYSEDVDELRLLRRETTQILAQMASEEKKKTGIKNLKIGYNRVFGYYIDVTKANLDKIPEYYIRKQTLANSERFITEELKILEEKIIHAKEKLYSLEYELFIDIRDRVRAQVVRIQTLADALASLDVYRSFAVMAMEKKYVRPTLVESPVLNLREGRHPVIESLLVDEPFIPNDCQLKEDEDLLAIITGPNMAGKSTYIRMVAILAIMAQSGSYVPAAAMTLGLVDRIFARVGASDDLARGDSTFMVEMKEVAYILRHATLHSLIILDEVGRGTSTIDGLSIAWAISEYILGQIKARTLFATHYHELIALEEMYEGVVNLSMAVKEEKDRVIFLRTVIREATDQSYGIHVAKMAGLPLSVIARASQKLRELGENEIQVLKPFGKQTALIEDHPVIRLLEQIDPENLSPKQALDALYLLKEKGETS